MTFDSRARRAAQGIHRAVEVMEMSSTKTPQPLTRFDEFRERRSSNQRIAAALVGIGLVLALVVAAMVLSSDGDSHPGGTTTTTTPAPPVSTVVAGSSVMFNAPFSYTTPSGWSHTVGDDEGFKWFRLDIPDAPSTDFILLSSVVATKPNCTNQPKPGVGTSSDAMTSWLSTHPALDATTPQEITLPGASGSWVDVQVADDWDRPCRNGIGLVTGHPDGKQNWGIYGGQKERYYVLDLASGDTVTIVVAAPSPRDFQDAVDEAAPVVESFDFRT